MAYTLPKPDTTFRGKYYSSGRGTQSMRKWTAPTGSVELTKARVGDADWYELRVRRNSWEGGSWFARDYENKSLAEKGAKIALIDLNKKSQADKVPLAVQIESPEVFKEAQKKDFEDLRKKLPKVDY